MLRRVNLVVLLGLVVGAVFIFGLTAGAAPGTGAQEDEVGEAQKRLAGLRMNAGAAYEAHGNAVFQLGELDGEIAATTEDLTVAEEDLGEAQSRLEDRASRMYKSGNVGFIDVLVGAKNFSEFSNRLELWVRLLARERAEFDRVREIRDTLTEKKALLEATRERRVGALKEADSQLDRAAGLEEDAQAYLSSLNAEIQAAMEAEQARQVELARAEGERIRAEIAAAEPEAVQPASQPEPAVVRIEDVPAEAIPAGVVTEVPAPKVEAASAPAEQVEAPEKTVAAEPVAATVPEAEQVEEAPPVQEVQQVEEVQEAPQAEEAPQVEETPQVQQVEEAPQVEETPQVDLAAQQQAERQAARAAKEAAEQRAAEQAAAERYAAEKAAAAEEARLAAEQATAAEEQYAADQAAEAERRAELAAQRAAAEQQAAEQAAAQQAEAERLAQQQATEQPAAEEQYAADQADQAAQPGKVDQQAADQYNDEPSTAAEPTTTQYGEGGSTAAPAPAAPEDGPVPAAQPATTAPAPASSSGSAVVAEASTHMGAPYVFSPPGPCSSGTAEDCSCHTMLVYQAFGISLPDDPVAQFGMGVPVSGPPQAGDLVFWAEGGAGITHVGIATGNGTTVHASAYAGYVTETPIDNIPGYVGARRLL